MSNQLSIVPTCCHSASHPLGKQINHLVHEINLNRNENARCSPFVKGTHSETFYDGALWGLLCPLVPSRALSCVCCNSALPSTWEDFMCETCRRHRGGVARCGFHVRTMAAHTHIKTDEAQWMGDNLWGRYNNQEDNTVAFVKRLFFFVVVVFRDDDDDAIMTAQWTMMTVEKW